MALSFKVGTFDKPTSTGTQAVTGIGFQPKFLMIISDSKTSTGFSDTAHITTGYSDGTTEWCQSAESTDNVTTTDSNRSGTNTVINIQNNVGTVLGEANVSSFDSDGFTLNWTIANGSAIKMYYIAWGGADLTNAAVDDLLISTSSGNQSFTGIGFQPDFVFLPVHFNEAFPQSADRWNYGLGFASGPTERGSQNTMSEDNNTTSDTWRYQRTSRCTGVLSSSSGAVFAEADFVSFDADGFTINWTTPSSLALHLLAASFKGGQYKVGSFSQATSTGNQAVTGVGFEPTGLMLLTTGTTSQTTVQSQNRLSIGAADGTSQFSVWVGDQDNVGTSVTATSNITNKLVRVADPAAAASSSTVLAEAGLVSLDSDGFTVDWTTADATSREILYIAFGSATSGTTFNQAVAGSITSTGALTFITSFKQTLAGSISATGTLARKISTSVEGSITATGSVLKNTIRVLAGSITSTGALASELSSDILKTVTGSITATGALTKKVFRSLSGSVSSTGSTTKKTSIDLDGSINMTGDPDKGMSQDTSGSITPTGNLTASDPFVPAPDEGGGPGQDGSLAQRIRRVYGYFKRDGR